jgi:hypothetical protein
VHRLLCAQSHADSPEGALLGVCLHVAHCLVFRASWYSLLHLHDLDHKLCVQDEHGLRAHSMQLYGDGLTQRNCLQAKALLTGHLAAPAPAPPAQATMGSGSECMLLTGCAIKAL